jgi:hypothetical protein
MHYAYRVDEEALHVLFMSDWSQAEATYCVVGSDAQPILKTFTIDETVS